MPTFVVECYWPRITEEQVRHTLTLLGPDRNVAGTGAPVARLGCILLPSDGMAIFLFRATSALKLAETAEQAGLPFDRIVRSIHVGFDAAGTEPTGSEKPRKRKEILEQLSARARFGQRRRRGSDAH